MSNAASTGVLHGNTITLDAPVPPLEGQRVRVLITAVDDDVQLTADQQAAAWNRWIESGPQGPLEDDEDPGLP